MEVFKVYDEKTQVSLEVWMKDGKFVFEVSHIDQYGQMVAIDKAAAQNLVRFIHEKIVENTEAQDDHGSI